MSLLSRDRYESGLATLRRIERDGAGITVTELDMPAIDIHADATRVASLYVRGVSYPDIVRLVAEARGIRARLVMDLEDGESTIRITIARVLDSAEEAALAARMQADARMGGAA